MKPLTKKTLVRWFIILAVGTTTLILSYVAILGALQKLYGGPQATISGEAYGFTIGMSKEEVLNKYKLLGESGNIRHVRSDGMEGSPVAFEPKDVKMTPDLKTNHHWIAYRRKFPIWFQDFYFDGEKLTNITTHIRFYETP